MLNLAKTNPEWLGFAMEGYVFASILFFIIWYLLYIMIVKESDNEDINGDNEGTPLYWTGNCIDSACTQETYHSGLGNKCKVEIISKTDLLRARGYKTQ